MSCCMWCCPPWLAATCRDSTWETLLDMAHTMKDRRLKVSFFNSTPQVPPDCSGGLLPPICMEAKSMGLWTGWILVVPGARLEAIRGCMLKER
jgi:hypothetical protein